MEMLEEPSPSGSLLKLIPRKDVIPEKKLDGGLLQLALRKKIGVDSQKILRNQILTGIKNMKESFGNSMTVQLMQMAKMGNLKRLKSQKINQTFSSMLNPHYV